VPALFASQDQDIGWQCSEGCDQAEQVFAWMEGAEMEEVVSLYPVPCLDFLWSVYLCRCFCVGKAGIGYGDLFWRCAVAGYEVGAGGC